MHITKKQLKQIIKKELRESIINKKYDEPMTAKQVMLSLQDAVGRHGSGPKMAQALRDIADQIDQSHKSPRASGMEDPFASPPAAGEQWGRDPFALPPWHKE